MNLAAIHAYLRTLIARLPTRLAPVVVALLCAVVPVIVIGCSPQPAPSSGARLAAALRRSFPAQASSILRVNDAFVAAGDGFAVAPSGEPTAAMARRGGLWLTLPKRADDALRFRSPGNFEFRVREVGAAGEGSLAEGAVAYPRKGGTSFWVATRNGFEEWLLLNAGVATGRQPVAAWEIDGARAKEIGGGVEIADEAGRSRLRVTAPAAFEAGGRRVDARLAVRGARIELWVEACAGAVLVDPLWQSIGSMSGARKMHAAVRLDSGKVLVVGGHDGTVPVAAAELYDPTTSTWSSAGSMSSARYGHAATLLSNGKVLVTGGRDASGSLATTELYDPATNAWAPAETMAGAVGRFRHTATLLSNGKVLVIGGASTTSLATAILYDPAVGLWATKATMSTARAGHTATLLSNGKVVVTGGLGATQSHLASAEVYEPATDTWSSAGSMSAGRDLHTATLLGNGKVLVAGGAGSSGELAGAELYDPSLGTWAPAATMSSGRAAQTATLLGTGRVLVAGGVLGPSHLGRAELYDPATDTWSSAGSMFDGRSRHTATLLGNGQVLMAGGENGSTSLASAELLDPSLDTWTVAATMSASRTRHTITPLEGGRLLVVGGHGASYLASAELYDPSTDTWAAAASLSSPRADHTATRLRDGKVLVTGGYDGSSYRSDATLYDPSTDTWSSVASMPSARSAHTAALLSNGTVLVAGGYDGSSHLSSALSYDPQTNTWATAGSMSHARVRHAMTSLSNGGVLVTGGSDGTSSRSTADRYDERFNTWTPVASMSTPRQSHAATSLPNGKVLVSGGRDATPLPLASAEIYDATANTWTAAASMGIERYDHTAAMLGNGYLLVAGGYAAAARPTAEVYKPSADTWADVSPMNFARSQHTATLLDNGKLLVTGGSNGSALASAELYTPVSLEVGNPCMSGVWDPVSSQITHVPLRAGTPCPDGDLCNGDETCDGNGTCQAGTPPTIDDNQPCTVDACDPGRGVTHTPLPEGTACSDGDVCNGVETCDRSGVCRAGTPLVVDDDDPCTTDSCDPVTGVAHVAMADGSGCDDGDACTQTDTCQAGVCTGSNPIVCTAANATASCTNGACAIVSCNQGYGDCDADYGNGCEVDLETSASHCGGCNQACSKGNECEHPYACVLGMCKAVPIKIDDGNSCTADSCALPGGMSHTPLADGTPCFDGTDTRTCHSGACAGASPVVAPKIYRNPRYESPVRGNKGDLLMLAGADFGPTTVVVYKKVSDTNQLPAPPSSPAPSNTDDEGVITTDIWRSANALKFVLPTDMLQNQTYALWAATPTGAQYAYSERVLINDARPMWVSPGPKVSGPQPTSHPYVYAQANRPGIERTIRIVGRNLQHADNQVTQVRFTALSAGPMPQTFTAVAATDNTGSTQVERYVAKVDVPVVALVNNQPADYEIELSRDGVGWVELPMRLTVLPDPPTLSPNNAFNPEDYGGGGVTCDPCVTSDHTLCIARAIHAADDYVKSGHPEANVVFGRGACGDGVWNLETTCRGPDGSLTLKDITSPLLSASVCYASNPPPECYDACRLFWGIPVPPGVNLVAEPANDPVPPDEVAYPVINVGQGFAQSGFTYWEVDKNKPPGYDPGANRQYLFQLLGNNRVEGIRFTDTYQSPFASVTGPGSLTLLLSGHDITIVDNWFDGTYTGIGTRLEALPTLPGGGPGNANVVIEGNTFDTWFIGASLDRIVDSVLTNNIFLPGGFPTSSGAGANGSRRLYVGSNKLMGNRQANAPGDPQYGFRFGFFFPLTYSQEDLLLAGNTIECVGTRPDADGEAIGFDARGDEQSFRWSEEVQAATTGAGESMVTLAWPSSSFWTDPNVAEAKMVGAWLRVVHGPGLGQARKVTGVSTTSTTITIRVSPPFDVLPVAGSRVLVGRQHWQVNIVDNRIDNTCDAVPTAHLTNLFSGGHARYPSNGVIGMYGSAVDVAIESNEQINTSGVYLYAEYADRLTTGPNGATHAQGQTLQYFIDVRGNHVEGQFGGLGNTHNTFGSGLTLYAYSSTTADGVFQSSLSSPGFGVSVAGNVLADAAVKLPVWAWAQRAGIAVMPIDAPQQSPTPGYVDTLVFDNEVHGASPLLPVCTRGVQSPPPPVPPPSPNDWKRDSGISIGAPYQATWGARSYPHGTVLCGNTSDFGCLYTDWPGPQGASSSTSLCSTQ